MNKKKQRNSSKEWVSASDVGRAAFCPHYLELNYNGTRPSQDAIKARENGNAGHDKLNKQAQDKRCFVASHLYGIDDPRTIALRNFRDKNLIGNRTGRLIIYLYYKLSPSLVVQANKFDALDRLLRNIVNYLVKKVQ